jgi:hypothetical protein
LPQWYESWLWSLPLILATVILHVFGLGTIREKCVFLLERVAEHRSFRVVFALVMGVTVLLVTALHAVEAAAWGVVYLWLGALPEAKSAMLYSLSAMTTYGHASLYLEPHWQMMALKRSMASSCSVSRLPLFFRLSKACRGWAAGGVDASTWSSRRVQVNGHRTALVCELRMARKPCLIKAVAPMCC